MNLLTVGVPTETKPGERRVGLTPDGVRKLSESHVNVFIQSGAGVKSGFSNEEYKKSGGTILETAAEVWRLSDIIKKIKEPIENEFQYFKPNQILFTYLHLASEHHCALLDALIDSKITAIAYETIVKEGQTPLLKPMSEVAGTLAAYYAGVLKTAQSFLNIQEALQTVAARHPKVPNGSSLKGCKVVILGGGIAGTASASMADSMGASVTISELSIKKREEIQKKFSNINCVDPLNVHYLNALHEADVIIGAVHTPGQRAMKVISEDLLQVISKVKKKIIIDISIDQGGNVAGSKPVTYNDPIYTDAYGNIRFSVTNMPSLCGSGASVALEQASLPYLQALTKGLENACGVYPELISGINVRNGIVTNEAVRLSHKK